MCYKNSISSLYNGRRSWWYSLWFVGQGYCPLYSNLDQVNIYFPLTSFRGTSCRNNRCVEYLLTCPEIFRLLIPVLIKSEFGDKKSTLKHRIAWRRSGPKKINKQKGMSAEEFARDTKQEWRNNQFNLIRWPRPGGTCLIRVSLVFCLYSKYTYLFPLVVIAVHLSPKLVG